MKTYEVKCKQTRTYSIKSGLFGMGESEKKSEETIVMYIQANSQDDAFATVSNQLEMCKKLRIGFCLTPIVGALSTGSLKTEIISVTECDPVTILKTYGKED